MNHCFHLKVHKMINFSLHANIMKTLCYYKHSTLTFTVMVVMSHKQGSESPNKEVQTKRSLLNPPLYLPYCKPSD